MLEERVVKKEAAILCVKMSHFNILHGRYRLRSEKWREDSQNGSSRDDRDREVKIEMHVIGISTCSIIIIGDSMNECRTKAITDIKELRQRCNC